MLKGLWALCYFLYTVHMYGYIIIKRKITNPVIIAKALFGQLIYNCISIGLSYFLCVHGNFAVMVALEKMSGGQQD